MAILKEISHVSAAIVTDSIAVFKTRNMNVPCNPVSAELNLNIQNQNQSVLNCPTLKRIVDRKYLGLH